MGTLKGFLLVIVAAVLVVVISGDMNNITKDKSEAIYIYNKFEENQRMCEEDGVTYAHHKSLSGLKISHTTQTKAYVDGQDNRWFYISAFKKCNEGAS